MGHELGCDLLSSRTSQAKPPENSGQVRARMGESLDEALSSGNAAKQKALLSFAKARAGRTSFSIGLTVGRV